MSEARLPRPTPMPPFFSVPEGSAYLRGQSPILDGMFRRGIPVTRESFLETNFPTGPAPGFNVEDSLPDFLREDWPETYANWLEEQDELGLQDAREMKRLNRVLAEKQFKRDPSRSIDEWEELLASY